MPTEGTTVNYKACNNKRNNSLEKKKKKNINSLKIKKSSSVYCNINRRWLIYKLIA